MSLKIQNSKMRIKRSSIPGVVPTLGPSSDHTDGTWISTNVYPGEYFVNIPDERLWIGGDNDVIELSTGVALWTRSGNNIYPTTADNSPMVAPDIIPQTDVTGSLGTSSYRWESLVVDKIEQGSSVTASGTHASAGGTGTIANHYGEWARGNVAKGQSGFVDMARRTTDNTAAQELFLDGTYAATGSSRFSVAVGEAYFVTIRVVAIVEDGANQGASKAWQGSGVIKNIGGTTSLVASITLSAIAGDAALNTATALAAANNTDDALLVSVAGVLSTNIRWHGNVQYVQVAY